MSPTERGVHARFSFPRSQGFYVVLDDYTGASMIKIISKEKKIISYVHNSRGLKENFKNYFIIIFDKPFVSHGTWENKVFPTPNL